MSEPVKSTESDRQSVVRRCLDLLAEDEPQLLVDLVQLAARVCGTPWAAISLVEDAQQSFKVVTGTALPTLPREQSFCGTAILQDDPFVVPNAFLDDRFRSSPIVTGAIGIRFYAGVPLLVGAFPIGTLCVLDASPRSLSDEQTGTLRTLARAATAELARMRATADADSARLAGDARAQQARAEVRQKAILDVNNAIVSNLTEGPLMQAISRALLRVVSFDRAALTLYNPETDRLRLLALEGRLPPLNYPVGTSLGRQDSHVGWAFDNQRTLLRRDLETERQFTPEHRLYDEGIRSLCTAPLVRAGKSIGTITLGSVTPGAFDEETERFLGEVADQVALAVSNMLAFEEIASLRARLEAENSYLQEEIHREHNYTDIVGRSPALLHVLAQIDKVAPTDTTVLITGETGTGKELFARAIHDRSRRKDRPLVKVNCGAISAGLVESELFGHLKGSFTGALQNRDGRFKLADGGSIFLDEVGELPLDAQVKLLRVLQEQEFEPVGSGKSIKVDVRVIAATNRNLEADVAAGRFRSDLFYRLNVFPIAAPALRERGEDVEMLAHFFVQRFAKNLGRTITQISRDTLRRLRDYAWPGNIRELQNLLERAVVLARGEILSLPSELLTGPVTEPDASASQSARKEHGTLDEVERRHIEAVLLERNWTIEGERGAAKVLNIHPNTLRSRMRKLGLKRPTGRA
jgi:formate hydrogenlyase transcriptional activator